MDTNAIEQGPQPQPKTESSTPATGPAPWLSTGEPSAALRLAAAEELLRARQYAAALPLFEKLLGSAPSARAGAGVASCLRRLCEFQRAAEHLAEIIPAFPDSAELQIEAAWLRVDSDLRPLLEKGLVSNAALYARDIARSCRDPRLLRHLVFSMIRAAKAKKQWLVVDEMCDLVDPSLLSDRPPPRAAEGWSDRARWMAAKTVALLRTDRAMQALALAEHAALTFRAQRAMFRRWQAQALAALGRLDEAASIYQELCGRGTRDWWLLHELGLLRQNLGERDEALRLLCRAALACVRTEMGVTLLQDLAACALAAGCSALAVNTADLAIQIRQRNGWRVPLALTEVFTGAGPIEALGEKDRLRACRRLWRKGAGMSAEESAPGKGREPCASQQAGTRTGQLLLPDPTRPFCFIRAAGERHFCLRVDLPEGAADGDRVEFSLVRSFDRKKQQESWRAAKVRLAEGAGRAQIAAAGGGE